MITQFFNVAFNVVLPIFLVMALGFALAKNFKLDLNTLSKLNFYVFIPVYMFYSLLIQSFVFNDLEMTVVFNVLFVVLSFILLALIAKAFRFNSTPENQ